MKAKKQVTIPGQNNLVFMGVNRMTGEAIAQPFRDPGTFLMALEDLEPADSSSQTVPSDEFTIAEILERSYAGLNAPFIEGEYHADEESDIDDAEPIFNDLTEVHEYLSGLEDKVKFAESEKARLEAEAKEAERIEAERVEAEKRAKEANVNNT